MKDTADIEAQPKLQFLNCFFGILFRPKQTIRRIVDINPVFGLKRLLLFLVITDCLNYLKLDFIKSYVLILTGFFASIFIPIINSVILWFIAKSFNGKATFKAIVNSRFWCEVPGLLMMVMVFIAFPNSNHEKPTSLESNLLHLSILYSWILEVLTYSEIQGFNVKKSLLNILIAYLVIAIPLVIEIILFSIAFVFHSRGINPFNH